MKYVLILVMAICFSCGKSTVAPVGLLGSWNWVRSSGGFAGVEIKASEKDTKQMVFKQDNIFEFYENGKLILNTTYVIEDRKSIYSQEKVPQIVFPKDDFMRMSYTVNADSLFVSDEVYDGFSHAYARSK